MTQTWEHLLFAHWAISPKVLREHIPPELELDTYAGEAWIGVIPFLLSGIRLHGWPKVPFTTTFPEINIRTYVKAKGKSGVYFLSLDASNPLVIKIARYWYRLPYYRAQMDFHRHGDQIRFTSRRLQKVTNAPIFSATYQPVADSFQAKEGTLIHWLTERYTLFCMCNRSKQMMYADVFHEPWKLQKAAVHIDENTMTAGLARFKRGEPDVALYACGVRSLIWPIQRLADLSMAGEIDP